MKGYACSFIVFEILLSGCNLSYNKEAEKKAKKDSSIQQIIEVEEEIAILNSQKNSSDAEKRKRSQALRKSLDSGELSAKMYFDKIKSINSNSEEDNQRNKKLSQLEKKRKYLEYSLE